MSEIVGSLSANGDGLVASGQILRIQEKYIPMLDGKTVGPATGNTQSAAEHLLHAIGERLPSGPASWGLTINCPGENLGVAFGNQARGGGGGGLPACAERVLRGRKFETLEEALRAAGQIIGRCCG